LRSSERFRRPPIRLVSCLAFALAGWGGPRARLTEAVADPSPAPDGAGRVTRTAVDLYTNRVHASSFGDGRLVVDAGSNDFLKYVDGGWKTSWILGARDQGKPAALVAGLSSLVFLPVDADGDGAGGTALGGATLSLTLRALAPKQRVSIFVNERAVGTTDLDVVLKRYDVPIAAGLLHAGENRVRLTFRAAATLPDGRRAAAALRAVALGPAAAGPPPADVPPTAARETDLGGVKRRALVPGSTKGSRLSFFVQPPAGAKLALGYGAATPGATVLVRVAADGAPTRTLHQGQAAARWTDVVLDLGAAAGQAARIDLVARGGAVAWADPRIVVEAPPQARPPTPEPRFDRIYVWMVDTLRADKVHAFNPHTRVQTPNYDAFAADATRFEWAQVPGTWSLPSHASLLTGVYPTNHKAVAHEARLSKDVPFVAEDMQKAGYKTGLFSSNGYVSSKWGFDRGWDVDRNFVRESLPNGADYLWKTAKAWLAPLAKKREFAYLATVEPHVIYNPKKQFLIKYWDKPYNGPIKPVLTGTQLGLIKTGKLKVNDTDKAYLEALHDAEITGSDAAFKTFIADLKAMGVYDRSVVVVVSDHGDQFYEHGSVGHGDTVYQELTHVPLIIRAPGLFPPGHVVHADVEIMDLYATMLDLAGIKPGPEVQGASLTPLVFDEVGVSPRAALTVDGQVARGLKVQRYRLVHHGPGRIELYDEFADPREQKNVVAERPIALRQMRNVLGLLYAFETKWVKSRWGTAANVTDAFNASGVLPGRPAIEPKFGAPP
jgi:arylsulfatase A-like enzyme